MHRARKRFGQHFLHDPGVIRRIVEAINPRPADVLVEIGPGLGALTAPLLERIDHLQAIEIDRDAVRHLRAQLFAARLHIHEADVLAFDFSVLGPQLRLIGNLPYNISTPLLFKLIAARELIIDMHFMLQKEVVDRMAAQPGEDAYGRLTVMLAPWLSVEPLFDIGPGAFKPPPRVVSTYVRLRPHATPPVLIQHPKEYAAVVAAAFSQRRKTLRNALKSLLDEREIAAAGVDPGLRAEVIGPASYASLADALAARAAAVRSAALL